MKTFKNIIGKTVISVLITALVLTGVKFTTINAEAASYTNRLPILCYTLNGRVTTYTSYTCKSVSGYIDTTDLVEITAFYTDYASVKVKYPTARGIKTAFAKASSFFYNESFSTNTGSTGRKLTAYKRSTGNSTIGTVYSSDVCIVTGISNGRTQILYPVSGGNSYKLGWVTGTYNFSSKTQTVIPDGTYKLVSALDNNYVADISGGSSESQANCQLYQSNGTSAQKFSIKCNSDGYYTITNTGSGKVLDCENGGNSDGTNVWQYDSNSTSAQRWKIIDAGNGYYTFICKCNGLALDVSGGNVYNGNNIQVYSSNGTNSQKWKLEAVSSSSVTNNTKPTVQRIVAYELSQVGTGDNKGDNNVKDNTWYWKKEISGSGYAWCMAFQAYCCYQVTGSNSAIPFTASCTNAVDYFKKRGLFHYSRYYGGTYTPKAGDLVFYTKGSRYSSCHVGMVTGSPVNGYLQTVEGNVKCKDGNYKVVKFTKNSERTINNSYVLGYASPEY